MPGKGQWGYVILIREGFFFWWGVEGLGSCFLPRRHLAEGNLPPVLSLAQFVLFHPSLGRRVCLQYSQVS